MISFAPITVAVICFLLMEASRHFCWKPQWKNLPTPSTQGLAIALLILVRAPAPGIAAETNFYLNAGIPAADREWRGVDYKVAAEIFTTKKVPLPKFTDPQGAALLKRLTSLENFSFHRNRSLPLAPRMEDFFVLLRNANAINKLYMNGGEIFHKEIAHCGAFLLEAGALGMELIAEFVPTIPKDEKYAIRMEGLKGTYAGITTMFVGMEQSLTEQKIYSPEDFSTLLEAMANTLPRLKPAFSADYRIELRRKLEAHRGNFKRAEDVRRIEQMLDALGK